MAAGPLRMPRFSLPLLCLVSLLHPARGQGVWSDLVNAFTEDFDYQCPNNTAVVGLASVFSVTELDRRWEYQCGTGGNNLANVSTTCTLQAPIQALGDDIEYSCPGNGYLGGFQSQFDLATYDRLWSPYCCERPFAGLVDCIVPTSGWENDIRGTLNFSSPDSHVVAGITSFYFNRDRRWRYTTCAIQVNCTDPGTPANSQREGDSFLYGDSVTYTCHHGYYQSEGPEGGVRTCQQDGLWSGSSPVCTACSEIESCADIRCTNATDHTCHECQSYHGPGLGEAAYLNLITECSPLCSWLQRFCYPGECSDGLASCNCSTGFSGPDCLNITVPSELLSCSLSLRSPAHQLEVDCSNDSLPLFTNILPQELRADWSADFIGPAPLTTPVYVEGYEVGVASSNVHTSLFRAANPTEPVSMVTIPCSGHAPSPDSPVSMSVCSSVADSAHLSNHTFLHGDTFLVEVTVVNGGYLLIRDLDTSIPSRHYYSGVPVVGGSIFILDVVPPVHCSLPPSSTPCIVGQALLDVGPGLTDSALLQVLWGGWLDEPAGIHSYTLTVYTMTETEGVLRETLPPVATAIFNSTDEFLYEYPLNVTEGAYSVVMRVLDLAGNSRYTRRLLLVDSSSELVVDNGTSLRVDTAVPETGFLWLNSTTTPVVVSGRGHFYNTHLRTRDLLAPVANFTPAIETEYDHPLESGLYPRQGTRNALGVTEMRYSVIIDQVGGASEDGPAQPGIFPLSTDDLGLQGAHLEVGGLDDGDSIRIWFQASDYAGHSAVDWVLFHVDSSAPELDRLWLVWNGVGELALHGTESLLDLTITFQTSDPHSGIQSLEYWIGTETSDVAWGQIPVQDVGRENCTSALSLCVCDSLHHCSLTHYTLTPSPSHFTSSHITLHDTEYYIVVTATNHALLTSSLTHTFTTDTTPPLPGVVMDAVLGSHDLDHTHNLSLSAWWADFFDRETSILVFQYHFGTKCLNSSQFSYPLSEGDVVMETTESWATWTAPGPGTYHVTVVTYNHALQPSSPACSDGITVDLSPPVISEVIIPGTVETDEVTYISTDHLLNVSWTASDNVGIRDYHIATLSDQAMSQGQSTNFTFVGRQSFFSLADSDLLSNGNTFYIVVKVTDLALHETEATFGPVTVDITPPVTNGNLTVERSGDHMIVTWYNDTFTDEQSGIDSLEYSIGSTKYGSQVLVFTALSLPSPLPCLTPHCLSLHTPSLPLLTGHTYHITLRARNGAGLESHMTSPGVTHIHGPPTEWRVIDLDPQASVSLDDNTCVSLHHSDTDLILNSDWLSARWEGFDHAHLEVNFSVGLSSIPGTDNTVPFQEIGTETQYSFANLSLASGKRYYITVIASNEYGTANASSDGFVYLSDTNGDMSIVTVADGSNVDLDTDYQYSSSYLSAHWQPSSPLTPYLSHYLWAVYQVLDPISFQLGLVREYENVGMQTSAVAVGMELRLGEMYVSAVQACLSTPVPYCLSPVYSDGIYILSQPQVSSVHATYTPLEWNGVFSTSSYGLLEIEWSPFHDIRIASYEWAVGTGEPGYELLTEWNQVEWYETRVTTFLNATLSLHKTNTLTLQGYNAAGLYSTTGVELYWNMDGESVPQNRVPRSKLMVYDIPQYMVSETGTTDWRDLEYSEWDPVGMEQDYTDSAHSLSAAWPDLRYMAYNYSVSTTPTFSSCDAGGGGMACGTTITNSVTIPNLELEHGMRYYVCVKARRDYVIHPSPSTPLTLTACTNGITVDLTPPTGGCVEIRPITVDRELELGSGGVASGSGLEYLVPFQAECVSNGSQFQASSSDIHIVWSPFHDVEWYGNAIHASGVAYYEYGIGTQPGDSDVVPFTEVGVVNDVITTGLRLQSGHTYYATVRAHDFTGQWSDVTSPGVTVDLTPPTGPSHFTLVATDTTYSTVPLFVDAESGVTGMEIALGSRPGSSDLLEWTQISYGNGIETYINEAGIRDGQLVFASIQVMNGAGLSGIYYSLGHTHDSTPPTPGIVYDTLSRDMSGDRDHTPSLSEISVRWLEWSDPHSPMVEYFWASGTSVGGRDVQDFLSVGVATVATRTGLSLTPGVTYYVTVRGCNLIGLCSEASSNGITVDVTPPITGWISDGLRGGDQQYQSSRSYIAAHWTGFHDAESSLRSYTVWAGTWPGDDSLLPPTTLPPSTSSLLHPLPSLLPTNITVYVHIVAISNAGLTTSTTSNGVFIDATPPEITNITVDTEWAGSVVTATQYSKTAIRVTWNTDSSLSPVHSNSWSILSYPGTSIPLDPQTVTSRDSGTGSGLAMDDGAVYSVLVVGCSGSGLCSRSQTHTLVLVDSSLPVDGYFATETNSTFPRSVSIPDGMRWRNRVQAGDSRVTLSFYGFSDAHSGISQYWAEIGTGFGESDLSQGSRLLSPAQDTQTGSWTATVNTVGHVVPGSSLYISLWGVNGVGLESRRVHGSFTVEEVEGQTNRGSLRLLRSSRCSLDSCLGHCMCAARGDLCPLESIDTMTCEEVGVDDIPEDQRVGVVNVSPQQTMATDSELFTSVTDKLVGRWEVPVPSPYQRLEWTVGTTSGPGNGLFDSSVDQIWREAGSTSAAIFSVNPLLNGETYVFYVRGWLNDTHYAVFRSSGITVDVSGPRVVSGGRLREGGSGAELDYTANTSTIEVTWNGVFIEELSAVYSTYEIGIGTVPGSDNVLAFSPTPSPPYTTALSGPLTDGQTYYTTLRATSPLSVTMDTISDGFSVDTTPPEVGVVMDGLGYHDDIAQSDTRSLSARWAGFHDAESGIHHYEMAWSESPDMVTGQYVDMGIRLRGTLTGLELDHGVTYYMHIAAMNNAGVWSASVSSNGITVDVTRPEQIQCYWEDVDIPSLEPISPGTSPCNYSLDTGSDVTPLPPSLSFTPLSGCLSHLSHSHPHSLTLHTLTHSLYTFSFWLTRQPGGSGCGHVSPLRARIVAPGLDEVVSVHTRNGDTLNRWSRFQFQFTADSPSSMLTLSPLSDQYGIVFDSFRVSRCHTTDTIPFDDVITNSSSVFHVSQEHVSGTWTRLRVHWEVGEGVGGVREYLWAIGTTERGEQLQPYTSTGSIPFGVSDELSTYHAQELYVSVVAWNQAGLETLVYGGPYTVDLTPPEVNEGGGVRDGGVGGVDLDYQESAILQADWSDIVDPESGIEECAYMIGMAAGLSDLHPHTPTTPTTSSHLTTLTNITHGTLAITTVTCRNAAGLQATFSSDGVTILQTPPTNDSAYLAVSSPLLTVYPSRDSHVASRNVTLHWGGFTEPAGTPLRYEVCLGDSGECVMVGTDKKLTLDGVGVASFDEEDVSVTAINLAGLRSSPLRGQVVFQTNPPMDNGAEINATWVNGSLHFDWSNKFTSATSLTYELSLGTITGSGIIRKWVELSTDHTHYTTTDYPLSETTDYFLSLVAISLSGLHTTASHMESGLPLNT